jgi:hypothetical protein
MMELKGGFFYMGIFAGSGLGTTFHVSQKGVFERALHRKRVRIHLDTPRRPSRPEH